MSTTVQLLESAVTRAQLTPEQQVDVLLSYIERQQSDDAFSDYLEEACPARLVDNGDGTVTDVTTGLMWMRPLLGQSVDDNGNVVGEPLQMSVDGGIEAAAACNFAGYSDWRMPTKDELETLVQKPAKESGAHIDEHIFGNANSYIWSSSPNASNANYEWYLLVDNGYAYGSNRLKSKQVRLVRSGQ